MRGSRWLPLPFAFVLVAACGGPVPSRDRSARPVPSSTLAHSIGEMVPALLVEHRTTGAAVALLEHGQITLREGYGIADAASGAPVADTTRLNLASVSKSVTALGILRLVGEGALSLDVPATRYLESWPLAGDPRWREGVTIRRLLAHTAGVGLPSVPSFPPGAAPDVEDVLRGRTGAPQVAVEQEPGTGWRYSGGGYALLQRLAEVVTGTSFAEFMETSVLLPMGMDGAEFGVPGEARARGHGEDGEPIPPEEYVGAAAAGLYASAVDLAALLRGYHEAWSGRSEVIALELIRSAAEAPVAVTLEGVEGAFYGLGHGVHRTADGRTLLYHSGGNPGFRAYMIIDPAAGDGLVVLVNSDNGVPVIDALRRRWGELFGGDLPPLY